MLPLSTIWTQFFPPRDSAPITEAKLASQTGKVFVVTGGSSGLGYELARILYGAGGKVYILTRSQEHADNAISRITAFYRERGETDVQRGSLHFIFMDLMDLATVRAAAQEILSRETGPAGRLDVLFNNAGTGARREAPPTRQGHEYHFGVNSLGGFLLVRLLTPLLAETARRRSPAGSVRVVWSASCLVDLMTPEGGIRADFLRHPHPHPGTGTGTDTGTVPVVTDQNELYSSSKAANWFLASEFARRQPSAGVGGAAGAVGAVLHIAGNPGNYNSNIWRHAPALLYWLLRPILRDPVHGAETYLFMAFSESVTLDAAAAGRYVIPDGRWHPGQRSDLLLAYVRPGLDHPPSPSRSRLFFGALSAVPACYEGREC